MQPIRLHPWWLPVVLRGGEARGWPLQLDNFCTNLIADEGGITADEGEIAIDEKMAAPGWSHLGSWVATSRIRQPHPAKVQANSMKETGSNPDSFGPSSSPSRLSLPTSCNTSPGSSSDSDVWQKPMKYTCQQTLKREKEPRSGWVKLVEFGILFLLLSDYKPSNKMELGHDMSPSPKDFYMDDAGGYHWNGPEALQGRPNLLKPTHLWPGTLL